MRKFFKILTTAIFPLPFLRVAIKQCHADRFTARNCKEFVKEAAIAKAISLPGHRNVRGT